MALGRLVRAVDAVAVELAGQHVGQVGVPDLVGLLGQRDPLRLLRSRRRESNRQSSTLVAFSEKRAKLTPAPSQVAPSG